MDTPVPPSPENLRRLYEALPDYVEQLEEKREARGEKRVSKSLPKNLCDICGRGYNHSYLVLKDSVPEMDGHCPRCETFLKEGYTALIAGNEFAFIKSASLEDMAGKVQKISSDTMTAVKKNFTLEWNTKEPKPE